MKKRIVMIQCEVETNLSLKRIKRDAPSALFEMADGSENGSEEYLKVCQVSVSVAQSATKRKKE